MRLRGGHMKREGIVNLTAVMAAHLMYHIMVVQTGGRHNVTSPLFMQSMRCHETCSVFFVSVFSLFLGIF